jgi:hypothetical protein
VALSIDLCLFVVQGQNQCNASSLAEGGTTAGAEPTSPEPVQSLGPSGKDIARRLGQWSAKERSYSSSMRARLDIDEREHVHDLQSNLNMLYY